MQYVEIRIQGRLDREWADWLEGLSIFYCDEETILTGHLPDQAGIYGLIGKLRDLGVHLISVQFRDEAFEIDEIMEDPPGEVAE